MHHLYSKRSVRTKALIASVTTVIEEDCCQYMEKPATAHGVL
jgi:hypothetical protein